MQVASGSPLDWPRVCFGSAETTCNRSGHAELQHWAKHEVALLLTMRRVPLNSQIRQLSKVLLELQAQVTELEQQHRLCTIRHTCIRCLAEGLQIFQCLQAQRAPADRKADHHNAAVDTTALQTLLTEEQLLLKQLAEADSSPGCCSSSDTLDMGVRTVCPLTDPMALFRALLEEASQQQPSRVAELTAQQLAQQVSRSFSQLSIALTKLTAKLTADEAAVVMKDIQDRHLGTLVAMVVMGKPDVLAALQSYNLETMQSDPSFLEAATEQTERVAPDLGLTEQQTYAISTGMDLYLGLMEGIQTEQVCLKFALSTIDPAPSTSDACSSPADLDNHAAQLEEQQQLYRRLQSLLRKEYILQFVMTGWLVGSLSYEQLAKASVLCLPYVIRLTHLGVGIRKWYKQQQQQQAPAAQPGCPVKHSS